jgi:flagellar motor switch protein FliM
MSRTGNLLFIWKVEEVKGKEEGKTYSLKKPLAAQISKVDWQSESLTSEQRRFLTRIFTQFAELLPPHLTPVIQMRGIAELQETQQISFKEFLDQFLDPTAFATFRLNDKTRGLWVLSGPLSFFTLDCMMGGKGEIPEELREFTEIEKALLEKHVLNQFLLAYQEAWKDIVPFSPVIEQIEFSPNYPVIFPYRENMVSARFVLRISGMTSLFHVCFPFRQMRETIPRNPEEMLTQTLVRKSQGMASNLSPVFGRKIESAFVPVVVELGQAEVFFQDLINLEEGDMLRLFTRREEPLKIKIAGKTKFLGKPGASENKLAVQITQAVQEGDESFDE